MSEKEYTRYQLEVIKRYYKNLDALSRQRLGELLTEIYLAEGKMADRLWQQVGRILRRLGVPDSIVEHVVTQRDIEVLAKFVQELTR